MRDSVILREVWLTIKKDEMHNKMESSLNEKGSKVEAEVAMCPLLSLFRREENRDGDT